MKLATLVLGTMYTTNIQVYLQNSVNYEEYNKHSKGTPKDYCLLILLYARAICYIFTFILLKRVS